ncbi:hypothetical protein GCM10023321_56680 [Pseudonocardia eucalypti]|uniref:LysR substrate-binding domain-containing protein n=1 Tax=Pseudonocardia eucalypti TaxID=648755 RepID=A0ABP9QR35_9PSEU|nr:hypothetical protein [Pseudonocardia eucalypti]
MLNRRTAPATSLHAFHQLHPGIDLDVITLPDAHADAAVAAVAAGTIDATVRAVMEPRRQITSPIRAARAIDDRHQLLVGPRHPLADAASLTPGDLRRRRIWMPGMRADTEWGAYYDELAEEFGLSIDTVGPAFGTEVLLEEIAESADVATLVGEGTRYLWPESYDLRRIPIVDPTPVYPHSVIWRDDNAHPGLAAFLDHLRAVRASRAGERTWAPSWARA